MVNDVLFLSGIDKGQILGVLKPYIFFDDQSGQFKSISSIVCPYIFFRFQQQYANGNCGGYPRSFKPVITHRIVQ